MIWIIKRKFVEQSICDGHRLTLTNNKGIVIKTHRRYTGVRNR